MTDTEDTEDTWLSGDRRASKKTLSKKRKRTYKVQPAQVVMHINELNTDLQAKLFEAEEKLEGMRKAHAKRRAEGEKHRVHISQLNAACAEKNAIIHGLEMELAKTQEALEKARVFLRRK